MTSPIHRFLFSPPPSPPLAHGATTDPNAPFTPLRSLVDTLSVPSGYTKPPTPRVPETAAMFPLSLPALPLRSATPSAPASIDVEAANRSFARQQPRSPRPPMLSTLRLKLHSIFPNVPRPVIRLVAFVAVIFTCVTILSSVVLPAVSPLPEAAAAKPSPKLYGKAHRMARVYVPPKVDSMPVAPNPRTFRPQPHPMPPTEELLALQSHILESPTNDVRGADGTRPLDAADILGTAHARRLHGPGSSREALWFRQLVAENEHTVALWFSSVTPPQFALEGVSANHRHARRAALVSTATRSDGEVIEAVFKRLGHDLTEAPALVIGGEVIHASREAMDALRASGELEQKLVAVGWREE